MIKTDRHEEASRAMINVALMSFDSMNLLCDGCLINICFIVSILYDIGDKSGNDFSETNNGEADEGVDNDLLGFSGLIGVTG